MPLCGDKLKKRPTGAIVGAVPTGGPPRTIGYTPIRSMWHGFATCGLRPATGAPYKGRPRPTNLSGLLGHLPYKGRHNDERIAEGDKPRATNHEPRTTGPLREPTPKGVI